MFFYIARLCPLPANSPAAVSLGSPNLLARVLDALSFFSFLPPPPSLFIVCSILPPSSAYAGV